MIKTSEEICVKPLDRELRRLVYKNWMVRQFPRDELKPLSAIERTIRKGMYEAWGMWEGKTLVAYAMLGYRNRNSAVLLDYYGVKPDLKHMGYGSAFLKKLQEVFAEWKTIIIESENPDFIDDPEERAVAVRRLGFYSRNGCIDSGLKVKLFGVEFNVLMLPAKGVYDDVSLLRRRYGEIYRGFLPNSFYNKFVKTHF